jgi:hypothetical protein
VFVAIVVFSMQFLPALLSPINSPVIVTLSEDQAVTYTAAKTNELLGGQAAIISADDAVARALILPRAAGAVIFVGHGSPESVEVGSSMVSWEAFADSYLVSTQSNQIYLAACYSAEASEELTQRYGYSNVVVSFKGCVDADFAAYYISATLDGIAGNYKESIGLLKELSSVMFGKILRPEEYDHYVLTSAWVDGIYFTEYNTPYGATHYFYTHPDWGYYGLNYNSQWSTNPGQGLAVSHIPASVVSAIELVSILENGVNGVIVAGAAWAGVLTGGLALIAAAVLAAVSLVEAVFISTFVVDELGSSWFFVGPQVSYWSGVEYYVVTAFKIGSFPWCLFEEIYLYGFIPIGVIVMPTTIGGAYLGIGGV